MLPRVVDPRIEWLVNFVRQDLPTLPSRWDRLRAEIADFCTPRSGLRADGGVLLGLLSTHAPEGGVTPPVPTLSGGMKSPSGQAVPRMTAISEDEIAALRGEVQVLLADFIDGIERLDADRHELTINLRATSVPQLNGGRWPLLVITAPTVRELVLATVSILLTRAATPPLERCKDYPRCRRFFAKVGKRVFCSTRCQQRVLMEQRRQAEQQRTVKKRTVKRRRKGRQRSAPVRQRTTTPNPRRRRT
jgi:hypothetical protein